MGCSSSKEETNRSNHSDYAPVPAPAPRAEYGRYSRQASDSVKFDPREQRQPHYQQQQYTQPLSAQIQPPPSSTVTRPTDKRPKKIKPEYFLEVTCLHCTPLDRGCFTAQDLNATLDRRYAYRNPTHTGPPVRWTLAIDCCSILDVEFKAAEAVVKRFCGVNNGYGDEGMGITYGTGGLSLRSLGRGGSKPAGGAASGPFEVEALLKALREKGIKFKSSV